MDELNQNEKKNIGEERQVVVFKLSSEEFGVNISEVREIIRMEAITQIPNTSEYIKGVINLRGKIIVVIDLSMKLGLPSKPVTNDTRIIVIEVNESTVGMIVDSATEVLRLPGNQVEPAPQMITQKIKADYIEGVGIIEERLLILLDLVKVLEADDMNIIKKTAENVSPAQIAEAQQQTEQSSENILGDMEKSSEPASQPSEQPVEQPAETSEQPSEQPSESQPAGEQPAENANPDEHKEESQG